MENDFADNKEQSRFELELDSYVAYANYRLESGTLFIDYVFAPPELRGTGAAPKLMEKIMNLANENNWQVTPICGYAANWMKRNKK